MTLKQDLQLLLFLSLMLAFFIFLTHKNGNKPDFDYITEYRLRGDENKLKKIIDDTVAQGVVVYDASADTILGKKNMNRIYSLASLTKIVTATIVYENNKGVLNDIRNMMKTSSNEEAQRLALYFGKDEKTQVGYMNNFTKRFGVFYFRNVSGLDISVSSSTDERLPGGEAELLALIGFIKEYYFKYPEIFDQTIILQDNTNKIVDHLSFLNGSKTGFTDLSGGNLFVSVQKGLDRQIFIIVLNSTEKSRFVDVQNIADFLLQSSI